VGKDRKTNRRRLWTRLQGRGGSWAVISSLSKGSTALNFCSQGKSKIEKDAHAGIEEGNREELNSLGKRHGERRRELNLTLKLVYNPLNRIPYRAAEGPHQ